MHANLGYSVQTLMYVHMKYNQVIMFQSWFFPILSFLLKSTNSLYNLFRLVQIILERTPN